MKITAEHIKTTLEKDYGWSDLKNNHTPMIDELLKDTISIINEILIVRKNISIKK